MKKQKFYEKLFKRIFDFFISLIVLVVISPLLVLISILVRIIIGSPVFFFQERPGKNEKIFTLIKFRTMKETKDANGVILEDEHRQTKFGKFLRKYSLDELPSLINILKGEMSIVGPRPLLVEYLEIYTEHQKQRHLVKPGLTGLAQVMGRNSLSWDEKFSYDIKYVNNITFKGDIKIMILTFFKVIRGSDVNTKSGKTMEKFNKENQAKKRKTQR